MSEDRYRLSPVRDQRARDERVRRGDLAAAVGDARETEGRVAVAAARVTAARGALADARGAWMALAARPAGAGATAAALVVAERFVDRRRAELAAAIDAHLRADAAHRGQLDQVDAARGRLALARAEREVIERHFAQWRTARKKLAERRED